MAKKGAAVGSLTGLVAGVLVLHPLLGVALGTSVGAITASFADVGIEDDFIMDLAANFKPGSSALFTLVVRSQPEKILETFQGFGGKILTTSMTKEKAARLQADLDAVRIESEPLWGKVDGYGSLVESSYLPMVGSRILPSIPIGVGSESRRIHFRINTDGIIFDGSPPDLNGRKLVLHGPSAPALGRRDTVAPTCTWRPEDKRGWICE